MKEENKDDVIASLVLIFKILLMLMECSILLMGNTAEMAGGDMYTFG